MLLSVIGRDAKIIQAHMCPYQQRLKVRSSQLFDFSYHTPAQRDGFLRWLLSDPITETKPIAGAEERSISPTRDTVPQVTVSTATRLQAGR